MVRIDNISFSSGQSRNKNKSSNVNNYNSTHKLTLNNSLRHEIRSSSNSFINKNSYSPAFGATFWGNLVGGMGAGAAAGAAGGAQVGGTVDLGTLGTTLGVPTATATAVGAVGGAIAGGFGGIARYFHQDEAERLEKENKRLEEEKKKIEENKKQAQAAMDQADARNKAAMQKNIEAIAEAERINALNSKYNTKALDEKRGIGLGKIAGYSEDKKALNEAFISPFIKSRTNPEICENVPNGVLLYGLTGNGKTTTAIALAEQALQAEKSFLDKDYNHPNFYDLSNKKSEEVVKNLEAITQKASAEFNKKGQRSIVFIDEFDGVALAEDKRGYNATTNAFLKTFLNNCSNLGITLIATTNHPQNIEEAFIKNRRRFAVQTALEPPVKTDIQDILEYYLDGLTDETVKCYRVAEMLDQKAKERNEKYTCSSIEVIAEKAKKQAQKQKRLVSQNDLLSIIQSTNPDLTQKSLNKFKADFELMSNGVTYDEYLKNKE